MGGFDAGDNDIVVNVGYLVGRIVKLMDKLEVAEAKHLEEVEARVKAENQAAYAKAEAERLSLRYQSAEEAIKTRTKISETVQEELKACQSQLAAANKQLGEATAGWERDVGRLTEERNKAETWKTYVHEYLDKRGVPKEFPEGKHTKEGCRIGDRLDYVFDQLVASVDDVTRLKEANPVGAEGPDPQVRAEEGLRKERLKEQQAMTPPEFLKPMKSSIEPKKRKC